MDERDKTFVREAIKWAMLSKSENNLIKPRVGAVLVKDGEQLATAFRGETELHAATAQAAATEPELIAAD
jgi:hypothetical protein